MGGIAGFIHKIQHSVCVVVRIFLDVSTDLFFGLIYNRKALPRIYEPVLLESAHSLAAKIRTRKVKCRHLIETFIIRIKEVNPIINAVVHDNFDRAMEEAKKVDDLIASGMKSEKQLEEEAPFLGVPFTVKESIGVKDLRQTCCIVSRKNMICVRDADVVSLMCNAGAINLGNTNTSEVCSWWESTNNVYGTTSNPYDTRRTAGGSSGGEGAIIAAAGSVIGIGSDIDGSIRIPAVFNGIFGHKATGGLMCNDGELPTAVGDTERFSQTGPMCRYATDLLPLFKVLATRKLDRLKLDQEVHIPFLKIYYTTENSGWPCVSKIHPEVKKALTKVISYLEATHGIIAQHISIPKLNHATDIWFQKMGGSGAPKTSKELGGGKRRINAIWELVKWFFRCSKFTLASIVLALTEKCVGPGNKKYEPTVKMHEELVKELEDLLGSNGVFIYPTHPRPAPFHHQPLFMPFNFSYTGVFNVLEFPACSCPVGLTDGGVPVGVQVVANKYNDRFCLAMAVEIERGFGGWVNPSQTKF